MKAAEHRQRNDLAVGQMLRVHGHLLADPLVRPGRLATDAPDSPHLLAPKIKSRVYIAGAIEDASFTDEMKARLEDALTKAGVDHKIETSRCSTPS